MLDLDDHSNAIDIALLNSTPIVICHAKHSTLHGVTNVLAVYGLETLAIVSFSFPQP